MDFTSSVQQQHDAVGRFLKVLEQEETLLTGTPVDINRLSSVTEEKSAYAAELEALEQARQELLVARGYTPNRAGAGRLADAVGCAPLWQAFIERVDRAQTQNRINGQAIDTRLDFSQRALMFLQRATGEGLYGPNGQTSAPGNNSLHSSV